MTRFSTVVLAVMLVVSLMILSGCEIATDGDDISDSVTAVCIKDVQYWVYGGRAMSPSIDSETLTFIRCE